MPTVRDQAVCLRVWDWSETSQTVSLFSREHGVLRALAKGSRRADARFSGGLEVTTRGEMVAIVKPAERSTETLATLAAWDLQEIFPAVRTSISAFHGALYMLDLVRHCVHDADPHPELFDALVHGLRSLGARGATERALLMFQWATLDRTGYRPELGRDVSAGRSLGTGPTYWFSPSLGGLVTREPSPGAPAPGTVWQVRAETVEALRRTGTATGGAVPDVPSEVVGRANRFLAWYARTVLGTWPPSVHAAFPGIALVEP